MTPRPITDELVCLKQVIDLLKGRGRLGATGEHRAIPGRHRVGHPDGSNAS